MGLDCRRVIDTVHPDLTCTICLDILSLDCLAVKILFRKKLFLIISN